MWWNKLSSAFGTLLQSHSISGFSTVWITHAIWRDVLSERTERGLERELDLQVLLPTEIRKRSHVRGELWKRKYLKRRRQLNISSMADETGVGQEAPPPPPKKKKKKKKYIYIYEAPLGTWIIFFLSRTYDLLCRTYDIIISYVRLIISYVRLIMSYVRHKLSRTYDLCRTYDLNACMVSIQSPCIQRGHEASAKHSSISSGF